LRVRHFDEVVAAERHVELVGVGRRAAEVDALVGQSRHRLVQVLVPDGRRRVGGGAPLQLGADALQAQVGRAPAARLVRRARRFALFDALFGRHQLAVRVHRPASSIGAVACEKIGAIL